jgi:hypothetical protein
MEKIKNRGWSVVIAGLGINLALGILYTWSIFKQEIKESIASGDGRFDWDIASLNDPFAVCCLMFTLAMLASGFWSPPRAPIWPTGFWVSGSSPAWALGSGTPRPPRRP